MITCVNKIELTSTTKNFKKVINFIIIIVYRTFHSSRAKVKDDLGGFSKSGHFFKFNISPILSKFAKLFRKYVRKGFFGVGEDFQIFEGELVNE